MPLYEYECFVCHKRFERIRRVADASGVDCPECGGKVRRLLGAPALQFKGSGWYVTDYGGGRSQGTTSATNGNGSTNTADGAGESKKDSKADTSGDG